jgi:alpha-glucosidase
MKRKTIKHWWQTCVIYQIYIRSFKDTNEDGIGDIRGVIQQLDYLTWLGIDAIWLTPFYPSPMKDFGYDITDYKGIHPLFGKMADFEELLQEVHKRDLKLIVDFVPNHTSDQHPWFKESRSSLSNPKRDWYYWCDPNEKGGPPNNWKSVFGGSAWEWEPATKQYYYHAFLKEQPDCNWRNPEVQKEMQKIMRFWMDKGVDGFRVDVMWHMIKDARWRNNPPNPGYKKGMPEFDQVLPLYSTDQPEVHEVVGIMRRTIDEYKDKVLIGEMYLPVENVVDYYGEDNQGAHLPGNFQLLLLPWDARTIALEIDKYDSSLPPEAWPNWVLSNHDRPRLYNRIGKEQIRVAAMLLLTLRGTPTLYYGDEIGMHNVEIPKNEIQDPQGKMSSGQSRDPQRTPMQWDSSANAGFSKVYPWLPVADDYAQANVEKQKEEPESLLQFYKKMIALRKKEAALNQGLYAPVPAHGNVLGYVRETESRRLLVVLNLGNKNARFTPQTISVKGKVLLSTNPEDEGKKVSNTISIKKNEGMIISLES